MWANPKTPSSFGLLSTSFSLDADVAQTGRHAGPKVPCRRAPVVGACRVWLTLAVRTSDHLAVSTGTDPKQAMAYQLFSWLQSAGGVSSLSRLMWSVLAMGYYSDLWDYGRYHYPHCRFQYYYHHRSESLLSGPYGKTSQLLMILHDGSTWNYLGINQFL